MADNFLYIPFINPVKFYEVGATNPPAYNTRHFDDHKFENRLLPWQEEATYQQVWQTTDIINLQFIATFNPITVQLINENGEIVEQLPALIGLPNLFIPNAWAFEVNLSLGPLILSTGCYKLKIIAGTEGPYQKIYESTCLFISSDPLPNTFLVEYWNSRYHQDVIFETGIKFQYRSFGNFGFLSPGRNDEFYRDQRYNPTLLSSKTNRQWNVFFGNEFGLPDEAVDLVNRIWSCDNVLIDGKPVGVSDNSKLEFVEEEHYPKRGVQITVEEGINRNSKIFTITTDPNKKIMASINVDARVFGDTSNQGSSNTVPVFNVEVE